jgi:hypothetical protein
MKNKKHINGVVKNNFCVNDNDIKAVAAPGFLAPGGKCHNMSYLSPPSLAEMQPPSFGALSLWRPGAIAPS